MSELWPSLMLSLRVAGCATALVAAVSIPLAFVFSRWRFTGKSLIEALLTVPLVLPPTVVGYCLIVIWGRRGLIGRWLDEWFDYSVVFHWHGAVLAAAAVSFPLLYLPARSAFASVEREMEDIAKLFGANRLQIFWHVSLPMARKMIVAGLLLTFSRALGEFGATVMVLGDIPRYQTLPIVIYNDHIATGGAAQAAEAVTVLTAVSLVIILAYNHSSAGRQS